MKPIGFLGEGRNMDHAHFGAELVQIGRREREVSKALPSHQKSQAAEVLKLVVAGRP